MILKWNLFDFEMIDLKYKLISSWVKKLDTDYKFTDQLSTHSKTSYIFDKLGKYGNNYYFWEIEKFSINWRLDQEYQITIYSNY